MNKMRKGYAAKELCKAIKCLATHSGNVKERLKQAYQITWVLNEDDFPPELQDKWKSIHQEMTKLGPSYSNHGVCQVPPETSIEHTMRRIRNKTAEKIAETYWELYWEVGENREYL